MTKQRKHQAARLSPELQTAMPGDESGPPAGPDDVPFIDEDEDEDDARDLTDAELARLAEQPSAPLAVPGLRPPRSPPARAAQDDSEDPEADDDQNEVEVRVVPNARELTKADFFGVAGVTDRDSLAAASVKALDALMRTEDKNRKRVQPALPRMSKAAVAAAQPKRWRVVKAAEVPRAGGSFRLPAGKVVNDRDYSITELQYAGVELVPVA